MTSPATAPPTPPADPCAEEQQLLAQALRDTAFVINQSLNLGEVLQLILQAIGKVVPHDAANIMLVDGGIARITAMEGYEKIGVNKEAVLNQRRAVASVPNMLRMIETGESVVIPDTSQSTDWVNFATSGWIRSYLSTPIRHHHKTIGFINLNSSVTGFYSERYAERLRAFADQAAIAIQNARLYEKATDELAFRKKVEQELQNAMNELENRVEQRTAQLKNINEQLKLELERRQKAERALELERASLAQRVEERTADLSAANAELARAATLKDAFLANMSHELRTPLNAILNVAETLEEQVYGPLNERQLRAVHTQQESANHLLSLINDILDLSKIGAGKFELMMDLVPAPGLCAASLKLVEEAALKKNIDLSLLVDPAVRHVWGDMRRLKQVLVNLLSNAVKFTPPGGSVGLTVGGDPGNNLVRFTVWDTGIGIPAESIPNMFKPFTQLDNSLSRKYEGTGLGLALAYHIVEMHGGGIAIHSEEGKGSQLTVTLQWDDHSPSPASDPAPAAAETCTSSLQKLQRIFSEFGIEYTSLLNNGQCVEQVAAAAPNAVVLNLPAHSECHAVARAIRAHPGLKATPILVATSAAEPRAKAYPAGTILFNPLSSRQEFRNLLKSVSVTGTASLVRRVVFINPEKSAALQQETNILLVDDNEASIRPVYDYLASKGYRVALAYNGAEAILRARERRFDLILMDIQMPGMDGMEAIRRIRADSAIQRAPIIALTALAMPGDRQRCLDAGANGYISKPISLRNLIEVIENQVRTGAPAAT